MIWGKLYWPYWMALTGLTFIVPELVAVFTNVANTLSDYARSELHVGIGFSNHGIHTVAWWISLVVWLTFVVWITGHIWWAKFG